MSLRLTRYQNKEVKENCVLFWTTEMLWVLHEFQGHISMEGNQKYVIQKRRFWTTYTFCLSGINQNTFQWVVCMWNWASTLNFGCFWVTSSGSQELLGGKDFLVPKLTKKVSMSIRLSTLDMKVSYCTFELFLMWTGQIIIAVYLENPDNISMCMVHIYRPEIQDLLYRPV